MLERTIIKDDMELSDPADFGSKCFVRVVSPFKNVQKLSGK